MKLEFTVTILSHSKITSCEETGGVIIILFPAKRSDPNPIEHKKLKQRLF